MERQFRRSCSHISKPLPLSVLSQHDFVPRLFPVPLDCGVQITASTSFTFTQIAPRGRPRGLTSRQSLTTGMTTGSRSIQLMLGISLPQAQDWVGYITTFTTFQAKMLDVVAGTGGDRCLSASVQRRPDLWSTKCTFAMSGAQVTEVERLDAE